MGNEPPHTLTTHTLLRWPPTEARPTPRVLTARSTHRLAARPERVLNRFARPWPRCSRAPLRCAVPAAIG